MLEQPHASHTKYSINYHMRLAHLIKALDKLYLRSLSLPSQSLRPAGSIRSEGEL